MPNEFKMIGNQRIHLTDAEQATLDASRVKSPEQLAAEAKAATMAALHAPFVYNGDTFGMTPDRQAVYDSYINKHGRGKVNKSFVMDVNDDLVKFLTPAALKAFLDAVDDELQTRLDTAADAL